MATIVVSADRVIAAGLDKIKSIEEARKEMINKLLGRLMRKPTLFLGITLRKGINTKEQALAYIESEGMYWSGEYKEYTSTRYAYSTTKENVAKLIYLARSGDPVTLNQDDCANLHPYL